MLHSDKRIVAICAPTGSGKSPAYIAAALLSKVPTCIVTNSRGLQDQLMADFGAIGLTDIRGRRNYDCGSRPGCTCEEGYASNCSFKGSIACPSSQAEMRAATSMLVVTNYAKWTAAKKYGQGMAHFQQVIFDEGHECVDAVASALQVELNHKEIEETLGMDFPVGGDTLDFQSWKNWVIPVRIKAMAEMTMAQSRIAGVPNPRISWCKHYTHMRNLAKRLAVLSVARPSDWVVEETPKGFKFDPISVARYSESTLFLGIPKVIIISATLRPKTMYMLGQTADKFDFIEFDSTFDHSRCPIYWIPTMRVDSRQSDLRPLWARHDQIASARQDRKGIVQTVSFTRRDEVCAHSRFHDRMMINPQGEAPTEAIDEFRMSAPGTILVSPSVASGYNFPMSDCEWQFLCKIPFSPPSKILKAREEVDKEYRAYEAMQKMVQIFGRGMRSKVDQCENFIGDDHLEWFLPKFRHLAPKSFHGFFKKVEVLPRPLKRL